MGLNCCRVCDEFSNCTRYVVPVVGGGLAALGGTCSGLFAAGLFKVALKALLFKTPALPLGCAFVVCSSLYSCYYIRQYNTLENLKDAAASVERSGMEINRGAKKVQDAAALVRKERKGNEKTIEEVEQVALDIHQETEGLNQVDARLAERNKELESSLQEQAARIRQLEESLSKLPPAHLAIQVDTAMVSSASSSAVHAAQLMKEEREEVEVLIHEAAAQVTVANTVLDASQIALQQVRSSTAAFSQGISNLGENIESLRKVESPLRTASRSIDATVQEMHSRGDSSFQDYKRVQVQIGSGVLSLGSSAELLNQVEHRLSEEGEKLRAGLSDISGASDQLAHAATEMREIVSSMTNQNQAAAKRLEELEKPSP